MSIGITVELKVEDIANSIKKLKKEDCRNMIFIFFEEDGHQTHGLSCRNT